MDNRTGLEPQLSSSPPADLTPVLGGVSAWSPDGKLLGVLLDAWKASDEPGTPLLIPHGDLIKGIAAGVMFEDIAMDHDSMVAALREQVQSVAPREVGAAFVASLSGRRLDWRSALGSYAYARLLPEHSFEPWRGTTGSHRCGICGVGQAATSVGLNRWSAIRLSSGGWPHNSAEYAWFDLTQFRRYGASPPTQEDWEIFRAILRVIREVPGGQRASHLEKALVKVFPSNQDERRTLIEILAIAGVIESPGFPGYFKSFVRDDFSNHVAVRHSDWVYPACRWKASGRVNELAVAFWFDYARLLGAGFLGYD